jgi:hypothetical protein
LRIVDVPSSCYYQPIGKANSLVPDNEESGNANQ